MAELFITERQYNIIKNFLKEDSNNIVPTAQDQVKKKVNAGIMDAVTGGGMCETKKKENKRIFVTESQYKRFKEYAELNILLEDKRTNAAKKQCLSIIRNHFNNASWLDTVFNHNDNPEGLTYIDYMFKQFMSEFYHNPDYRKKATMRLAPLFCRLAFESNFQNNNPDTTKLNRLLGILNFIYQLMEKNKLDVSKISLDLTYEELNNQFGAQIDQMNKDEDERINNAQYTENSEYTVIGPVDFKTANKYGDYSCPSSKLCYTQSERTWNNYTKYNKNNVYILLKDGWENIEANHDNNSESAYDTYGLSMIFVFVGEEGELEYCNTRWNHDANYAQGFSCDHAMSREMISELIGRPFNEVFKPSNVFKEKIEALKGMTEIPKAYFRKSDIKEMIIPNNITSIGNYAFADCRNLTHITIPDSVTSIGNGAFTCCPNLISVILPSNITSIGYDAFSFCEKLKSITIPDSVTSIGNGAFACCHSLTHITLPNGITSIENFLFYRCKNLKSITIPDSVTSIWDKAFANCNSIEKLTIPNSVISIGRDIVLNCDNLKQVIAPQRFARYFKEEYNIDIIPNDIGNMHEGAEPESDEYNIGMEGDSNLEYGHVFEGIEKDFDYKSNIKSILDYMSSEGLEIKPYPSITLKWNDQNGLFITTGYYSPIEKRVVLFCKDRHPKDILRSFCHELIHHMQNIQGKNMNFTNADDVKDNKELEELESEAYLKGNIYFRKWTEYERKKDNVLNESIISISQLRELTKELDESLEPNEVDLSSFNIKRNLNPKFWKNDKLDSRIRMKLLDIADDFIDYLGVDWVKPEDITITGSLANFNWNEKYSDIDLHIIMDYSKVDKRKDFVSNYFYSLKKNWNEEHEDLKIYGFPIEVYVQDKNEKHTSSGVYSLEKNEWIDEPERNKIAKVKVNKTIIKNKVSKYTKDIDSLEDEFRKVKKDNYKLRKLSDKAEKIFNKLKSERKESLKTSNSEITEGNIIFKCLRRNGYIEKLDKIISDIYNKMNSLS